MGSTIGRHKPVSSGNQKRSDNNSSSSSSNSSANHSNDSSTASLFNTAPNFFGTRNNNNNNIERDFIVDLPASVEGNDDFLEDVASDYLRKHNRSSVRRIGSNYDHFGVDLTSDEIAEDRPLTDGEDDEVRK